MGNQLSILSDILVPFLELVSGLLHHFVSGNTLTALGNSLIGSTATLVNNIIAFLAQFSFVLSGNF